jgi:hypothetical protein
MLMQASGSGCFADLLTHVAASVIQLSEKLVMSAATQPEIIDGSFPTTRKRLVMMDL